MKIIVTKRNIYRYEVGTVVTALTLRDEVDEVADKVGTVATTFRCGWIVPLTEVQWADEEVVGEDDTSRASYEQNWLCSGFWVSRWTCATWVLARRLKARIRWISSKWAWTSRSERPCCRESRSERPGLLSRSEARIRLISSTWNEAAWNVARWDSRSWVWVWLVDSVSSFSSTNSQPSLPMRSDIWYPRLVWMRVSSFNWSWVVISGTFEWS